MYRDARKMPGKADFQIEICTYTVMVMSGFGWDGMIREFPLHPHLQAFTLPCRLFACGLTASKRFALQDALKLKARLRVTYAIWPGLILRKPNVTWISFPEPSQSRGSLQFQRHSTRDRGLAAGQRLLNVGHTGKLPYTI